MPTLIIDNQQIAVEEGVTLLDAARRLGIAIPTLCHLAGRAPLTSCFVCVVKVNGRARLLPACATLAADGMVVESETAEVHAARRTALELLLGDHLGDCIGPCQVVCPAHMDIPAMLRHLAAGRVHEALVTAHAHIALPAVMGYICPAPCEKGCRRALHDGAVSIRALERHVAANATHHPACAYRTGKRVAIVGAGPAGLAAAYALCQQGITPVLFDAREEPGGMLRYAVPEERLPRAVLVAEIESILALGAEFHPGVRVGVDVTLENLRQQFDAVLFAGGESDPPAELERTIHGIAVEKRTLQTALPGVFAAGAAVLPSRQAVRALGDGRAAAQAIAQYVMGESVTGSERRPYTVHMGRLHAEEIAQLLVQVSDAARNESEDAFTTEQVQRECARCLHCDCRKLHACALRDAAIAYSAEPGKYKGERRHFTCDATHPDVIYEPGKCIDCGRCVLLATEACEDYGLTFVGRGFDVRPAVPFNAAMADGLATVARACVAACPTGALAMKHTE